MLSHSLSLFQFSDSYQSLNPRSEVPTLEIDGQVMTQSVSDRPPTSQGITYHLMNCHPAHHLMNCHPAHHLMNCHPAHHLMNCHPATTFLGCTPLQIGSSYRSLGAYFFFNDDCVCLTQYLNAVSRVTAELYMNFIQYLRVKELG